MKKSIPAYSLFSFYLISLLALTSLSYFIAFMNLHEQRINVSKHVFDRVYHDLTENIHRDNFSLDRVLSSQTDLEHISYRLMIITPSGRPYIHNYRRPDQSDINFFTFPYWSHPEGVQQFYSMDRKQLLGYAVLPNGHEVFIQILHPPININWKHPEYWLPLLTALCLLIWGFYLKLARDLAWQYLIDYSRTFPNRLNEPYNPLNAKELSINQHFLRLSNSLNRINHQMHLNFRHTQSLKKRLYRISDYAPLPMLIINRNGQISYFNRRFEQLFMAVLHEDLSYFVTDFLTGKDKSTQQILTKLSDLRISRTLNVLSLQGNTDYLLHLTPWTGKQGQVQGFCAQLTDVSKLTNELKDIDIKIHKQADRLIEFDKMWSVLGHELRTPLSGIIGLIDLMDTQNFNREQLETYTTLSDTSQTMLTMLNDMLDMAKMGAGKLQVMIERTDILAMCRQVGGLMASNARSQDIELLAYVDPECPRYIDTDADRIRQALLNLLGNSIKFTQSGYVALLVTRLNSNSPKLQQIIQETTHISKQKMNRDWLCFTIKDTGIGISEEDKAKLFMHFNQANESISRQFGGTGLGLAISNNFAQLLGGFIHVQSSIGQGSEFNLCLPLSQASYQPVYNFKADLSGICLIAFNSQKISTDAFHTAANYLGLACLAYTGISLDYIKKLSKFDFDSFTVVFLIEEELYKTQDVEQLFELPAAKAAPKILLSMRPESAIPLERKEHYDAFMTKPFRINQLIKEILNLTIYANTWSEGEKKYTSKVQKSYDAFMQELHHNRESNPNDNFEQKAFDEEPFNQIHTVKTSLDLTKDHHLDDNNVSVKDKLNLPPLVNSSSDEDREGALILVAEDNAINRKVVCKILQKLGYRYITADNGKQALDLLEKHAESIRLILMDCRMPVLNGFETTQYIRKHQISVPIIALTANDTDADREECFMAGMNGFLSKPIKKEALSAVLQKFMVS